MQPPDNLQANKWHHLLEKNSSPNPGVIKEASINLNLQIFIFNLSATGDTM